MKSSGNANSALCDNLSRVLIHYLGFEEGTLMRGLVTEGARRKTYRELAAYMDSLYPPSL